MNLIQNDDSFFRVEERCPNTEYFEGGQITTAAKDDPVMMQKNRQIALKVEAEDDDVEAQIEAMVEKHFQNRK